jgi:hypothetical protein
LKVIGETTEHMLERLIGRQVVGLAYVPETGAAMLSFDADTHLYFRVIDNALEIEIEAPEIN